MRELNAGGMYAKSKLRKYGKALTLLMQVVPLRTHTLNSYMEYIKQIGISKQLTIMRDRANTKPFCNACGETET